MDLITIIICITVSLGFVIGRLIRNLTKEELEPGKKIIKLAQDIIFGILLVFLLITFNINWIIAIILALAYTIYAFAKKKEHKNFSLIILSAVIAAIFRTKYFLTVGTIGFIYTLITGIKTKKWKDTLKKTAIVLVLSLILIYLRII